MRALSCAVIVMAVVLGVPSVARADQLQDRISAASAHAAGRGTTAGIAVLDRQTGEYRDNGAVANSRIESASVMKLFIAENLLHRRDLGQIGLSATDLSDMSRMLRESYDAAANRFWSSYGNNAIVSDVIGRYGLTQTGLTVNARYWGNTLITAHDMVVFYQRLMDGSGGLSAGSRDWILDQLRRSTAQGDGGWQFFGLHSGLPHEAEIGQKQGWMCCVDGYAYRHSTGFVGPTSRFVVVVLTREPSDRGGAHLEDSITGVVRSMYPEGLIPRVQGAVGDLWYGIGGARSGLGLPVTDELPANGGAWQSFQGGRIYWSPSTGAHWTWGAVLQTWGGQGNENGPLGYPVMNEEPANGGTWQSFQGGRIYWSADTGAGRVWGAVLQAWGSQGHENGPLGYPVINEAPANGGAWQGFQGGRVYWSPSTGAHWLTGTALDAWVARGAENGSLGYPVSEARPVAGGTRVDFQHGSLTVTSANQVLINGVPATSPGNRVDTSPGTSTPAPSPTDAGPTTSPTTTSPTPTTPTSATPTPTPTPATATATATGGTP